jgi:hypothetical protein
VVESQALHLGAHTRYDSSSGYSVIADRPRASYDVTFNSPLPMCWNTTNSTADCLSDDRIETNTVIRLLGADWLVLDYTASVNDITSMTLGKVLSSARGMRQGDVLWIGASSQATLTEFSTAGSVRGVPRLASFKVETPAQGAMAAQLATGSPVEVSGITMRVNRAYLDSNGTARADVTAMSRVITLTSGLSLDAVTGRYWSANITSTMAGNSSAVRRIFIYSTYPNANLNDKFLSNQSMTIVPGEPAFEFSYLGLVTTNESYDALNLNVQNGTIQYSEAGAWTGPFVEIVSGVPAAFRYSSGSTTVNRSIIRIALAQFNGTTGVNAPAGSAFIQNTNGYWLALSSIPAYTYSGSDAAAITLNYSSDQCLLCVTEYATGNSGDPRYICALIDPSQGSGGQFADADGSASTTMLGYNETVNSLPSKAMNFVTDRGSRFISVSPTNVLIQYARTQLQAQYMVKNVAQNATSFSPASARNVSAATGLVTGNK